MMTRIVSSLLITLIAVSVSWADTNPTEGLVNYESPHVHPIDLTPDQNTLLAVNTAGHRLEIYDVSNGGMTFQGFVPVGIDPVSVRARSNTEAWVVNHISDSVSIVDISNRTVIRTLSTANEPADVVFAGSPERAFVTASEANSVQVFSLSNLDATPTTLDIVGEDPRALAVSPDGNTVYAAIFESGNGTTSLSGGEGVLAGDAVSRPEGPYGGVNPPPNDGNLFNPPINPAIGTPPRSAIIVRKDAQNRWMDGNNGDWSLFVSGELATISQRVVGWDLPDNDVAIINANTLSVSYQKRLMNIAMAIGVNPASGQVSVVGTDATNEIRFEPNLNGNFLRVNLAQFNPGSAASIRDLNPHLDYRQATPGTAVRDQSIGDPRAMAWNGNGTLALVSGMGSNNLIALDAQGNRVGRAEVGEGPTGVVIQNGQARAFVMNKFAGNISTVSLDPFIQTAVTAFDDPTPNVIKQGRKFLYDTHLTSGNGHMSCASCHVDARTDRLAWDLGNPAGSEVQVATANRNNGAADGGSATLSPIKGPMLTQTLQDIMLNPKMHWRGDKNNLNEFSSTFTDLMGNPQAMSGVDMMAMGDFLNTIHLPPNPYRNLDNSRPQTVVMPDGVVATTNANFDTLRGNNNFSERAANNCLLCHLQGGTRNGFTANERQQSIIAPNFAPFYERLGYWPKLGNGSTSGFGFFHSGSDSLAVSARLDAFDFQTDMLAELMTLEGPGGPLIGGERRQDTHAGVGHQLTISGNATTAQNTLLNQLVSIGSSSPYASLVANGVVSGVLRGFSLQSDGRFQSDRSSEQRSLEELLSFAANGQPITFMLVANGTESRMSTDRDNNGVLDGDEASNPLIANPDSVNVTSSATVTINPLSNDTGSGLVLQAPNVWSLNGGNVTMSGNSLRYTPKPGYNGQDTIYYAISDSTGNGSWSQINITVSGNNNVAALANPDNISVTSSTPVTIQPLSNDLGSGLVLQAPNAWSLQGGIVATSGNSLSYTPKPGFNGEDKIYYSIVDGQSRSSWSSITLAVSGNGGNVDVPVVTNADAVTVRSSATVTISPLSNDTGSGLVLQMPNAWSMNGGTVAMSGNNLSYTPKSGFNGTDRIYYSVVDSQNRSSWNVIEISVSGN